MNIYFSKLNLSLITMFIKNVRYRAPSQHQKHSSSFSLDNNKITLRKPFNKITVSVNTITAPILAELLAPHLHHRGVVGRHAEGGSPGVQELGAGHQAVGDGGGEPVLHQRAPPTQLPHPHVAVLGAGEQQPAGAGQVHPRDPPVVGGNLCTPAQIIFQVEQY